MLSCELLALWVPDLVVCIFIVYLCIHALSISYHLNWLMCHYFLCGWIDCAVAAPARDILKESLSSKIFNLKGRDNKLPFSDSCSKSCTVAEYKTSDVLQKVWTTVVNFSFETWNLFTCSTEKEWAPLHIQHLPFIIAAWLLAMPYAPCIRNTLNLESQHSSGSNNEHLIIDSG